MPPRPPSGPGGRRPILYAFSPVTDRTDPYEIIGVRRDASLAEIRISYRRSTQILAPERFANANETVRAEAARRLGALNGAMEAIEAERAAESGSALGSLTFGGPAVSSAAEPSLRSTAVADDPPLPPLPSNGADVVETGPQLIEPEEPTAPVELAPLERDLPDAPADEPASAAELEAEPEIEVVIERAPGPEPEPEPEQPTVARVADTEDGFPIIAPGEDTSEVPLDELPPEAEQATPAPAAAPAAVAPPKRPARERPPRRADRAPSRLPRILAAAAAVAAIAAVGAYLALGRDGGSPDGEFRRGGAPVSFTYPSDLVARKPPTGGLLKPSFATAVGVDGANYVVVATYRISADVQPDGSAIGSGGNRLTAERFDESVDRAAERIASAQKLTAKGPPSPGRAGDLIARIYDYTRANGNSARYAFAFRGHTEYSVACFWDPAHAEALTAACQQVMTSLRRETV